MKDLAGSGRGIRSLHPRFRCSVSFDNTPSEIDVSNQEILETFDKRHWRYMVLNFTITGWWWWWWLTPLELGYYSLVDWFGLGWLNTIINIVFIFCHSCIIKGIGRTKACSLPRVTLSDMGSRRNGINEHMNYRNKNITKSTCGLWFNFTWHSAQFQASFANHWWRPLTVVNYWVFFPLIASWIRKKRGRQGENYI